LSLEKRARKPIQRSQALKHSQLKQTQPEVVTLKDIETNENSNLTVLCSRILGRLMKVQRDGEAAVLREASEDMSHEEIKALMDKHGVHERGGVDLFKFVVNPYSFGQTVENMFYVSFLIRDGKAGITIDDDGLPAVGKSRKT
jgi:non-structural maintenance of chromosomes element 4